MAKVKLPRESGGPGERCLSPHCILHPFSPSKSHKLPQGGIYRQEDSRRRARTNNHRLRAFASRTYVAFDPSCMTILTNIPFHPGLESRARASPSPRGRAGSEHRYEAQRFAKECGIWGEQAVEKEMR